MATTPEDCKLIAEAVERNKVLFAVGHVMRYTPYSKKLKSLLNQKIVGEIINIQHTEPVGWVSFSPFAHPT
jgi:predicted dehydrogenase